jgi:4-azaleucine resistance transporter AzlC
VDRRSLRAGVVGEGARRAAPIGAAVFAFGVSYGVLARTAGMGRVAPVVMSATTFAGSAQFAVASILDNSGTVAAAILAAVLLNVRYAPISISVGDLFRGPAPKRLVQSQLIVDESWAMAARGGGRFERGILLGAGLFLYPCWVGGTALGVLGGGLLGNPERLGLDAAFPALFLALLLPQLAGRRAAAAAVVAGAMAFALVPVSPPGIPIIAASAACLLGWRRR